jgi:hypothetical protein
MEPSLRQSHSMPGLATAMAFGMNGGAETMLRDQGRITQIDIGRGLTQARALCCTVAHLRRRARL